MSNSLIEGVLTAADIPFREVRFAKPPASAPVWAEYVDAVEVDGADNGTLINALAEHVVDISLYESALTDAREELEAALDAAGLRWSRGNTYYLENAQRYETDYTVSYVCKR